MKPQAFQLGELRDEHDQIIRAGAYGKKTPFVSADNNAILDYIMNNFDALYAQIPNGRAYVKSVNNITPDSNGNVTINLGSGGGTGGTNITVDSTLSSASTNPVQNKVIYAALNNKLDKNGTATYAARDSSGNIISSTYARKTELSGYVKSINNVKPDSAGNVNISSSGGGSNITVDSTLSSTSNNAIANKAVYAALNNKLDKTGIAAYATRDDFGNIIADTYAKKSEVSGVVKSVNNIAPDSNGNVTITVSGGGGGSGDYLPLTGGTVTGGITATNFQTGTGATSYFQCRKFRGDGDANSYYHAIDFGYSGHDSVDFYEYDPNWNFYKCLTGTKSGAVLVGNINGNGWNGGARLTGAPTAPTAAVGTNTTQIATTAFVQTAVGGKANTSDLADFVTTSGQNTWRAQQTFNLATLGYEQYSAPYSSTNSVSPSTSAASYYATGAFTLNLSTLSELLGRNQSTVFTAYITAGGDYALSITNGGTVKYIGEASDVAITSAGLLLNILMTKDRYGSLTSIVQANKLT